MTAVIVRSSANVNSGAKTKASGVLHGVWLAVFALAAPALLGLVPMAALAAVLVQAGWKLVAGIPFRALWRTSRSEVAITVATIVAILTLNLLEGVAVGLVLSLVKAAVQASSLRTRVREEADEVHLEVSGSATFVRLPQLADTLESVPRTAPHRAPGRTRQAGPGLPGSARHLRRAARGARRAGERPDGGAGTRGQRA